MLKPVYVRFLVSLVSIAGLASCNQDNKNKPAGSAREARTFGAPTVFSQGSHLDVTLWPSDHSHESHLSDRLELGQPAPKVTDVHAICLDPQGGKSEAVKHFGGESEIAFYRTLPDDVLARDLAAEPARCEFVVQMSDNGVKRNGFRAFNQFKDDFGDLRLEGPKILPEERPRLNHRDLLHTSVINDRFTSGRARLFCRDAEFEPVTFNTPLTLGQFPVTYPHLLRKDVERPSEGGDQLCRVQVLGKDQQVLAMSQLLNIRFNESPLDVKMTEHTFTEPRGYLRKYEYYPLAHYQVTNTGDEVRRFKFNQEWFKVRLRFNLADDPNGFDDVTSPEWGRMYVTEPRGPRGVGANEVWMIKPGESLVFNLAYSPSADMSCGHLRVRMKALDQVVLYDLADNGNILRPTALKMPQELVKIQYDTGYKFDSALEHFVPGRCHYY